MADTNHLEINGWINSKTEGKSNCQKFGLLAINFLKKIKLFEIYFCIKRKRSTSLSVQVDHEKNR